MTIDSVLIEKFLPYVGGLSTAAGAFGTWYIRFRQENTIRQKYQLDYKTAELENIAEARHDLEGWSRKRLELSEQELARVQGINSELQERIEQLQHQQEISDRLIHRLQDKVKKLASARTPQQRHHGD